MLLHWGRHIPSDPRFTSLAASSALPNFAAAKWAHLVHQVPRPLRLAASLTGSHDVGQLATPGGESARMTGRELPRAGATRGNMVFERIGDIRSRKSATSETPAAAFGSKAPCKKVDQHPRRIYPRSCCVMSWAHREGETEYLRHGVDGRVKHRYRSMPRVLEQPLTADLD